MTNHEPVPDWSKAPEGATHWSPDTDEHFAAWYREKDGKWEFWLHHNDCSWDYAGTVSDRTLIPRPETAEWIPTNGKKPDLPNDTLVDVKFRGEHIEGEYEEGEHLEAGHIVVGQSVNTWIWSQKGNSYDITHCRIHQSVPDAQGEPVPDVQGEPAAWQREDRPDRIITKLSRRTWHEVDSGVEFIPLYPPEQHPDVSALVEALEELVILMEDTRQGEYVPDSFTTQPARIALAAYRKGGCK